MTQNSSHTTPATTSAMSALSDQPLELMTRPLEEVARLLRERGVSRFYFVTDSHGGVRASHPLLREVAEALAADHRDFDRHEGLFCQVSAHADLIHGAFVHRTTRGQGQGGTRFWGYPNLESFLRDGVRLSRGMTHKNALAGLWWGGGKGVISRPPTFDRGDRALRLAVFREYGQFISSLRGCYVTAEDVGTATEDMDAIFSETRFITCIPRSKGGSGNPSAMTALGVIRGMEAGLDFIAGVNRSGSKPSHRESPLRGKHVVVQGAGHVGEVIISIALRSGARVTATDISATRLDQLRDQWHGQPVELVCVKPGDITPLDLPCDVLCPAATGGALNPETIPLIQAPLICGAANNQLEDPERDGAALAARGIVYAPDFLVNRMGIVNCADEQFGYVDDDQTLARHLDYTWDRSVYQTSLRVLTRAHQEESHPHRAAVQTAEELSLELHPIWGHRGQSIIEGLSRIEPFNDQPLWADVAEGESR